MKRIKKLIGTLYMWLSGWSLLGELPTDRKYVLIAAPHTTNWDLAHMLAIAWVYEIDLHWMGKHTLFQGRWGWFYTWLGGVPVDRTSRHNAVEQMAKEFARRDEFCLACSPEGTRSLTEYWKSGFYHIAVASGVPIIMGTLDYPNKSGGFGPAFWPTGDPVKDMDHLRRFYADKIGKYPERFGPVRLREEAGTPARPVTSTAEQLVPNDESVPAT